MSGWRYSWFLSMGDWQNSLFFFHERWTKFPIFFPWVIGELRDIFPRLIDKMCSCYPPTTNSWNYRFFFSATVWRNLWFLREWSTKLVLFSETDGWNLRFLSVNNRQNLPWMIDEFCDIFPQLIEKNYIFFQWPIEEIRDFFLIYIGEVRDFSGRQINEIRIFFCDRWKKFTIFFHERSTKFVTAKFTIFSPAVDENRYFSMPDRRNSGFFHLDRRNSRFFLLRAIAEIRDFFSRELRKFASFPATNWRN